MKKIRTRFAPSPTGYMHIGNLRTALYEYLIARKNNGEFLLRIEDTDQERQVEGALEMIYDVMHATGLHYDEGPDKPGDYGPYIQSQRLPLYQTYADELVDLGGAHYCFCSEMEVQRQRDLATSTNVPYKFYDSCHHVTKEEARQRIASGEIYVVRQTIPTSGTTSFVDEVYGTIEVENALLDENVLLKSDGFPTYNFANIIDDHLMCISHVVRGNEYLSSTPKYNLVYQSFGWEIPIYVHTPPVMKDEQHKLSKRNGDASYQDLIKQGFLKDAILNYIALLGWAPEGEEEIFTLKELEQKFSIERISKSPAIFDIEKLKWMNGLYLRALSVEEFHAYALPYYQNAIHRAIDLLELSKAVQPRIATLSEIPEAVNFIDDTLAYDSSLYISKKMKTTPENSLEPLRWGYELLKGIDDVTNDEMLLEAFMNLAVQHEVKNGRILWPIRIALSGKASTPGGAVEIVHILGKEESLRRLQVAIESLKQELT